MAYAIAKEQLDFIGRMLRCGRFNNQSEVLREALRRMEREELAYLNPPRLTDAEAERIYGPNPEQERLELMIARRTKQSLKKRQPHERL